MKRFETPECISQLVHISAVDEDWQEFPCSFTDFLRIWLEFSLHLGGNLATDAHKQREGERVEGKRKKALLSLGVRLGDPHSQTYTHGVV